MERAQRVRVPAAVRRRLVACTRWPCTCLLQGGAAVCCPVETDSCRLPIRRPLWSETASRRSAGKTKTDWRSARRLLTAGSNSVPCSQARLLSGVIFTLIFPSFCDFLSPSRPSPLSGPFYFHSRTHCVGQACRHGWEYDSNLTGHNCGWGGHRCKRSESQTGKRQR